MLFPSFSQVSRILGVLRSQGLQTPISSGTSLTTTNQIHGGTPFTLCPASRDTDLFQISSAVIDRQPVYIEDVFMVHLDGEFLDTWNHKATLDITGNCGSYCDAYNITDPRARLGETFTAPLCNLTLIDQPVGYDRDSFCPPVKGPAHIKAMGYVWSWPIHSTGHYNFTFDAKTGDGRRIYCLTAEVCMKWRDNEKNERYNYKHRGDCTWPS